MRIGIDHANLRVTVVVHITRHEIHQEHLFARRFIRRDLLQLGVRLPGIQHPKLSPAIEDQVRSSIPIQITDRRRLKWKPSQIERLPRLELSRHILKDSQLGGPGIDHHQIVSRLPIEIENS